MHALPARSFGFIVIAAALPNGNLPADPVPVRHPQGSSHGFLALKTLNGKSIAIGDATQIVQGDRVTSRVIFRFRDGSIDDDVTVFSQRGVFRLISDHHIQRGPSFRKAYGRSHQCFHRADYVPHGRRESETRSSRSSTRRLKWPSAQSPDEHPSLHA